MSQNYLIVPLKLDLLNLAEPQTVIGATANFTDLPWSSGTADYDASTPYLGESVLKPAFQNQTLTLSSGTHIHFTLPKALRNSPKGQGKVAFPAAPNRWLVTRKVTGTATVHWVIESDYMSNTMGAYNMDAVTVPIVQNNINQSTKQPYMYLGRQIPLSEWLQEQSQTTNTNQYWPQVQQSPLTALGYGELSFSTFYPNCRSVFGFYDHEGPQNAEYEIVGWYDTATNDILANISSVDDLLSQLNWQVSGGICPAHSLFYGTINSGSSATPAPPELEYTAIGSTGTEALSAFLANQIDATNKPAVEDQLEAILMASKVPAGTVDAGPNFEESRHERGFNAINAGLIWTIRKSQVSKTDKTNTSPDSELDANISQLLNVLNQAQEAYDKACHILDAECFRLYSDWFKYMKCCYPPLGVKNDYPDVDQLQRFIEQTSLASVQQLQKNTGQLSITQNSKTGIFTLSASSKLTLAQQVVAAFTALTKALTPINQALAASDYTYTINRIASSKYYQANDPVVLFAGSNKNAPDLEELSTQALNCIFTNDITPATSGAPYNNTDLLNIITTAGALSEYQSSPGQWRPQIMQWLIDFFPRYEGSNVGTPDQQYLDTFISSNFTLDEDAFDFSSQGQVAKLACSYSGQTYVSASSQTRFKQTLETYLLGVYPTLDKNNFASSLKALLTSMPDSQKQTSNPGFTAIQAYNTLGEYFFLTQSLGGFHLGLLQHKNNLSLPIADPLGFSSYQTFTTKVAQALQGAYTAAPQPNALFMPVRAGTLSLQQLSLCDHFGVNNHGAVDNIINTNTFAYPANPKQSWLAPRLSQAARLNFRWLSATPQGSTDDIEINSVTNTSPVCGWFIANYLDNSLVCYSAQGDNLGSFNELGQWQPTPGASTPITSSDISSANPAGLNTHQLNVLLYIKTTASTNSSYIKDLINAFQSTQENIYPASYAGNDALSLLMGKPIAIVRASIGLETQGTVQGDQGWTALRNSMQAGKITSDNYENIQFPIRIGEYKQLDDGLIGYWVETGNSYQNNTLYINDSKTASFNPNTIAASLSSASIANATAIATFLNTKNGMVKREDFALQYPQGGQLFDELVSKAILINDTKKDANIAYYCEAGAINTSINQAPTQLTMLLDPHGIVHATSGILPVKTIQIPPQFYTQALKQLSINFLSAPIITPANQIQISLPQEPGHSWSWLSALSPPPTSQWKKLPDTPLLSQTAFNTAWQNYVTSLGNNPGLPGTSPWAELISKQWLSPLTGSSDLFCIAPNNSRQALVEWLNYSKTISNIIANNTSGLVPYNQTGELYNTQTIVEGWLQLT